MTDLVNQDQLALLKQQAETVAGTITCPVHLKTPKEVLSVMLMGRELGLGPMQSLQYFVNIRGKITLEAKAMMAIILGKVKDARIKIEMGDEECVVIASRNQIEQSVFKYSLNDAKKAGLIKKGGNWEMYPRDMLRSRAVSQMARAMFPDVIGGMYTAEETETFVDAKPQVTVMPEAPKLVEAKPEMSFGDKVDWLVTKYTQLGYSEGEMEDLVQEPISEWTETEVEELKNGLKGLKPRSEVVG
jgi:hypothetical protein